MHFNIHISLILVIIAIFSFLYCNNVKSEEISAKEAIVVLDYSWASGGKGMPAIISDITLKNTSIKEFTNIDIEIELYTELNTPLGSLRSTIKDILPPGSEKTFYNVKFGIMSSELEKSTARVVRADHVDLGTPQQAAQLILVKNWEWSGAQYGTEGYLKKITLENRGNYNYKDINIKISDLGVSGPKVGPEGYETNIVIHSYLPAKSTRTFRNINVGFKHPDSTKTNIYVVKAKKMSDKELRYELASETDSKTKEDITYHEKSPLDSEELSPEEQKLSLVERYRLKIGETQEDVEITEPEADTEVVKTEDQTIDYKELGLDESEFEDDSELDYEALILKQLEEQINAPIDQQVPQTAKINVDEDYERRRSIEPEEPLPKHDIVIRDFKWGSGVPGTLGIIKELTLYNRSGITYTKIEMEIEFLSAQGITLTSNDFKLFEIVPPNQKVTFENVKVGIIHVLPDSNNMRIRVKDAKEIQ